MALSGSIFRELEALAFAIPNVLLFVLSVYGSTDIFVTRDPSGIVAMYGLVSYTFRGDAIYPPSLVDYLEVLYALSSLTLLGIAALTAPLLTKQNLKIRFALSSVFFVIITLVFHQSTKTNNYNTVNDVSTARLGMIACFVVLDPVYRLLDFDIKKAWKEVTNGGPKN